MAPTNPESLTYPRRKIVRKIMKMLCRMTFNLLMDIHIEGQENVPAQGPLLVVGNHFSFIDPLAMVRISPWHLEFLGGFHNPSAPPIVEFIPWMWGYYPLFRGTGSRESLRVAETLLQRGAVIGIFPEAGNWAPVLRPARPGTAFLATRTASPLLPLGIDGLIDVLPHLRKGRRAKVTLRIGKPFGPFQATGKGRERREQLDEIGHQIMRQISELIPPERQGYYSPDPAIRLAAKGTEIYPWETKTETEYKTGEFL
jgi:1-acyl-sn-glycerol-3-phosphate acyltransferase